MTNRSQQSRQRTAICRFSFVIGHWSFGKSFSAVSAVVRKNVAPASRRHLSLDNSFWVNTTFAGWKPTIHFFSRPQSTRRCTEKPDASVLLNRKSLATWQGFLQHSWRVLSGVRKLARAFPEPEQLHTNKGGSKLPHSKEHSGMLC